MGWGPLLLPRTGIHGYHYSFALHLLAHANDRAIPHLHILAAAFSPFSLSFPSRYCLCQRMGIDWTWRKDSALRAVSLLPFIQVLPAYAEWNLLETNPAYL